MVTARIQSPLTWIGGKHYSASRIVEAFPHPGCYDTYVDLFGGAAHVLLARPPSRAHTEVFNDIHEDLINFWMHCRDDAQGLEARLTSLPYSRALYYHYHDSLYSDAPLDPLERAVRWFYCMRSSFTGRDSKSAIGWSGSTRPGGHNDTRTYRSALSLFTSLQERTRDVLIDARDFEKVFTSYNERRTLFYCDPPYIGAEGYYQHAFRLADHERLAQLLNASPAFVALSYYPHPLLDTLYPASMWRRITWTTVKHSQRTRKQREQATEMLLCNYQPTPSLWETCL